MKKKTLSAILAAVLVLTLLAGCGQGGVEAQPDPVDDNYRTFYQIFVGSFSDANGDGIGDLRGIINRFDYLNDGNVNSDTSLGVQGIWLSPIFTSPSYHKYDAKDYYKLDWRFGTDEDLKELAQLCHSRNVKLILDLAINHTSDQHEWFVQFIQARMEGNTENPYYDYYTCVTTEEKVSGRNYQKIAGVDAWFECNFSGSMPELNFDNPVVRQEMLNVAKHYLDLGVDGFRFDAVKYIYYGDTAASVDFWKWYMAELRKINPDIYCVGECWDNSESLILKYYEAMNCFNFAVSGAESPVARAAKGGGISNFTNYIARFQGKVLEANPEGMPCSFLSNHDQDRIAGAFVLDHNMKMAANLYLLSPGSPVIYYGEEIGMRGTRPGGADTDADRRLAMLWGDDDMIRDPVGATYKNQISTTVVDQMEDEDSMYRHYCRLLSVRHRHPAIARGTYTAANCEKNLGGFLVSYQDQQLVILHNNSAEAITYDLSQCKALEGVALNELLEVIGVGNASLKGTTLTIDGYTSVVVG